MESVRFLYKCILQRDDSQKDDPPMRKEDFLREILFLLLLDDMDVL